MQIRKPGNPYVFGFEKPSIVHVNQNIEIQVDRDPKSRWRRDFETFSQLLPKHERAALSVVVQFLRQHGRRLTQSDLMRLSAANPGKEIDINYMKRACSLARKMGLLTGGTGRGSKGYGLPEWEARSSGSGNGAH